MILIIISMMIWGSIGVFVKFVDLPSTEIAFLRALIAAIFLLFYSFFNKKVDIKRIKKNLILLMIAGVAMGLNWVLLFQSYKYTNIANSTMSYYFAPVIVIVLSPFLLKEKMTFIKIFSVLGSMTGLLMIMYYSTDNIEKGFNDLLGIFYGLSAALLYALVILITKYMKEISGFEITIVEMMIAALILFPFVLHRNQLCIENMETGIMVLLLGMIHTGLAYILYFTGIQKVKAQNVAVLSYIDPLSAILFSSIILGEIPTLEQKVGALLIFGCTLINKIKIKKA